MYIYIYIYIYIYSTSFVCIYRLLYTNQLQIIYYFSNSVCFLKLYESTEFRFTKVPTLQTIHKSRLSNTHNQFSQTSQNKTSMFKRRRVRRPLSNILSTFTRRSNELPASYAMCTVVFVQRSLSSVHSMGRHSWEWVGGAWSHFCTLDYACQV